jgi:hypothetical protein
VKALRKLPHALVFPLHGWGDAFAALAGRTAVKALIDPSPSGDHAPPSDHGAPHSQAQLRRSQ